MGLVSAIGGGLLSLGRTLGIVGGQTLTRVAPTVAGGVGRALTGPFGQSIAGGALGAGAIAAFGGGAVGGALPGGGSTQLAQLVASGAQPTELAGGRFLVTAPNGDVQIFNRNGMAVRPQLIIPAGQRLPGGAVVVSTRQGGALIGVTRRRRRKRFGAEIRNVRRTVQAANALVNLCKPKARRS